jgi:hypothetical protein
MKTLMGDPAPPPGGGRSSGRWYAGPAPDRCAGDGLVLTRLTAAHAKLDHAALKASTAYLRSWSDSGWPEDDFSVARNRAELGWHDEEHEARVAFTYSALDEAERRVLGCAYVRPLRDMARTRDVEAPTGPGWPGGDTPCVRGWVRRDEPEQLERRFLGLVTRWLTGPDWELPELWWTAASDDLRQLAALDVLGWTRELRTPMAGGEREWVFRAGQLRPSS